MRILSLKKLLILLSILILSLIFVSKLLPKSKQERQNKGLNISCFIYFDKNRDGIYDLQDQPYAGLPIKLTRPDTTTFIAKSNISGFANFKMFFKNEHHPINEVGTYSADALIPEHWLITSNNGSQRLNFIGLEGSPAGIILEETCDPIGISQILTITGKIHPEDSNLSNDPLSLEVISPRNQILKIDLSNKKYFTIPAKEGEWKFKLTMDQKYSTRKILVNNSPLYVSDLRIQHTDRTDTNSELITLSFDDLTISDTLYEIPNLYGRLNWTNWIATHHKFYKGYGYVNGTISNEYIAYNSSGHPATIWAEKPFDFIGTYISVAWPNAEEGYIKVQGWQGNELLYNDQFYAYTDGPIYFDANYQGITKVIFSTEKYWQLIIDNFKYRILE